MFEPLTLIGVSLTVLIVLAAIAVIREVGPGKTHRRVHCPDLGRRAKLEVLYTEPVWGTLQPTDVTRCSLFGPAHVTCAKKCLSCL